ncbi:MAG: protein translocase subunit SecD [Candidatus Moraniibacteriota bacterium]
MNQIAKRRFRFSGVLFLGLVVGIISYPQAVKFIPPLFQAVQKLKVNEGLDLQGGIALEYNADVSQLPSAKVGEALSAAEAVIERRVNAFGVGEPLVQSLQSGTEHHIIVELPGVKDIEQAKKMIKETPFLEFREQVAPDADIFKQFDALNNSTKEKAQTVLVRAKQGEDFSVLAKEFSQDPGSKDQGGDLDFVKKGTFVPEFDAVLFDPNFKSGEIYPTLIESQFGWHIIKKIEERGEGDTLEVHAAHILFSKRSIEQYPDLQWVATGLSGKNLKSASVDYQSQGVGSPQVALQFDSEGTQLFADITKRNIGKGLAIVLDGLPITDTNGDGIIDKSDPPYAPTIQGEIPGGQAVITGNYTMQQANDLVKRLNEGALPVPITLVGQQSVDASLGQSALEQSLFAGLVGLGAVALFMILYYRFLGLIAVFALLLYTAMLLAIFKLSNFTPFAITVTLSGIAGFILSIGIAVDANVLIFERTREELSYGKGVVKSIKEGFRRAWPSIRDGHVSTLITTFILIASGTGFVKGFAIILALGVLLSLFTAVVLVRVTMDFLIGDWMERHPKLLVSPKKPLE